MNNITYTKSNSYMSFLDSGNKILKTNKNYLKEEKLLFEEKNNLRIYGMRSILNKYQLYMISIIVISFVLMFPYGYNNIVKVYHM